MIQIMRDKPELLKTELGRAAHNKALQAIKGTWWEKTLFPVPISLKTERTLKEFRKAEQIQLDAIAEREQALFDAQAEKSRTYIERVKREGKSEGLVSAKDILTRMGWGVSTGDADRGGGEGA